MKNDMRHSDTAVMLRVENKSMMIKKPEIRKIPIPGDLKRSRIPWISKYRGSESCANIKFLRYLPKIHPDSLDFGIVLSGSFQEFKSPFQRISFLTLRQLISYCQMLLGVTQLNFLISTKLISLLTTKLLITLVAKMVIFLKLSKKSKKKSRFICFAEKPWHVHGHGENRRDQYK